MIDHDPKLIDPQELGVNEKTSSNLVQIELPRDKRGRIRWALPGSNEEENEQLGIRNVQALFLEAFPEFDSMFPREEGRISAEEEKEAKVFIIERIGSFRKFIQVFGFSPLHKHVATYFKGTFITAIEKSFAPWGLNFEHAEGGGYKDANGKSWVHAFYLHENSGLGSTTLDRLLKSVPSFQIQKHQLDNLQPHGKANVLYDEDEAQKIIDEFMARPLVDTKTGRYVNEQGKSFVVASFFKAYLSDGTISRCLSNIATIDGRDRLGREAILYEEDEVFRAIQEFISLPKVDHKTGIFTDDTGRRYFNANYLHHTWKIRTGDFSNILKDLTFIQGRDKLGKRVNLYRESEVIQALIDRNLVDPNTFKSLIAKRENNDVNSLLQETNAISSQDADEALGRLIR